MRNECTHRRNHSYRSTLVLICCHSPLADKFESGLKSLTVCGLRHSELTGLEPATSAVTGRRSNQLSYNSSEKVVTLELNLGAFNRKFLKK